MVPLEMLDMTPLDGDLAPFASPRCAEAAPALLGLLDRSVRVVWDDRGL